jgi:hypothetical protein
MCLLPCGEGVPEFGRLTPPLRDEEQRGSRVTALRLVAGSRHPRKVSIPLQLHSRTGYGEPVRSTSGTRSRRDLPPAVIAWRSAHGLIAVGFLASIGYVWWCALSGKRGRFLRPAIAALLGEGALVIANRGDCPLGRLGVRIGDPVPLFELVLSPRAARLAVPTLGAVTVAGLGLLAARSRSVGQLPNGG